MLAGKAVLYFCTGEWHKSNWRSLWLKSTTHNEYEEDWLIIACFIFGAIQSGLQVTHAARREMYYEKLRRAARGKLAFLQCYINAAHGSRHNIPFPSHCPRPLIYHVISPIVFLVALKSFGLNRRAARILSINWITTSNNNLGEAGFMKVRAGKKQGLPQRNKTQPSSPDYGSALPSIVSRELFLSRQTISQHTVHKWH